VFLGCLGIAISLLIISILLFVQFRRWRDALTVLALLLFAATGKVRALLVSGIPFSISAAVGFSSLIGYSRREICSLDCALALAAIDRKIS